MLHYRLHCSCFILFPSDHTSLFMFHFSSVSSHFIVYVSLLFPSVHCPSHSFGLSQSISFIFALFGCIHITWSFNHIVSFTFQPILSLGISGLRVSLNEFLILDRYSLREAGLPVVLLLLVSFCWAGEAAVGGCLGLLLEISTLMFCSMVLRGGGGILPGYLLPGFGAWGGCLISVPCRDCEGFVVKPASCLRFSVTCDATYIYHCFTCGESKTW